MLETDPRIAAEVLQRYGDRVMSAVGGSSSVAAEVALHLGDADLHGAYSHGIFCMIQYAKRARDGHYDAAAEQCLAELRSCPPAPGFSRVEIPGEREAALRQDRLALGIPIPPATLGAMCSLGKGLGIEVGELQPMRDALRA